MPAANFIGKVARHLSFVALASNDPWYSSRLACNMDKAWPSPDRIAGVACGWSVRACQYPKLQNFAGRPRSSSSPDEEVGNISVLDLTLRFAICKAKVPHLKLQSGPEITRMEVSLRAAPSNGMTKGLQWEKLGALLSTARSTHFGVRQSIAETELASPLISFVTWAASLSQSVCTIVSESEL